MRIVFIGAVYFSKCILEKLISLNANIVGVVTKMESSFNADFEDISPLAELNNIPYKYALDINDVDSIKWIKEVTPDVIFCFGWSNLLKKSILELPRLGVLGFHPSLLPANRGRHPLIWAKVLGLKKTGSTFFFMNEGADTGNILSQEEILIEFEDDAFILYQKMISTALSQIEAFLPKLAEGKYDEIVQVNKGNAWRKRDRSDGQIDFRMSSVSICNLVRGLSKPYVGAHCFFKNEDIKIWNIALSKYKLNNIEPGKIIGIYDREIEVKTGDGSVILIEHDFHNLPVLGEYIK